MEAFSFWLLFNVCVHILRWVLCIYFSIVLSRFPMHTLSAAFIHSHTRAGSYTGLYIFISHSSSIHTLAVRVHILHLNFSLVLLLSLLPLPLPLTSPLLCIVCERVSECVCLCVRARGRVFTLTLTIVANVHFYFDEAKWSDGLSWI